MKVYRGSAAAARNYVEADRSRADDYYLAEGTGLAERFTVNADGHVMQLASLSGDKYEAWVAGLDPETGGPRGRLRHDARAVRFVEVVVNGPKSWSLAAELHPDVAAAYEAAQDAAVRQIVGWLGQHATTRVGPRGAQVAVPVQRIEAAVIRHYTSRAGDPHRHLHLQVNARVFAAGKWRGIDTLAFRDSIQAINGIGHAAVACDPGFRAALAGHGYTLTGDGEIQQLVSFVGAFSKRAGQIGALIDRYEAAWRREHPDQEPGPALRRSWNARAWAEDRPDKVVPRDGGELRDRWLAELHALGYRDGDRPVHLALPLPGAVDREAAAREVLARLGAARSAWNSADVRGEVEQLLARAGVIAEPAVRMELAEDLTARALARCVRLPDTANAPEHVRALTSNRVLNVETNLVDRLAARGTETSGRDSAHPGRDLAIVGRDLAASCSDVANPGRDFARPRRDLAVDLAASAELDVGQRAAVAVLTGEAALVVVEGAAGAGKTTTLAATRETLDRQGHRLLVVTPTLKAAQAASAEIHTRAGSAAWLAWQHGWRWDATGTWTRQPAQPAPEAVLRAGDLLLVDEAGMLDQDTARALLTIADEAGARVALVGDRRQLPAAGRGGVLDLAHRWTHPDACVDLNGVHRFVRVVAGVTMPDEQYAALTLAMRDGTDPATVFDTLLTSGRVAIYAGESERRDALAGQVAAARAAGGSPAVVTDTREHAELLNAAIRDRLIATGRVDDRRVTITTAGQRLGAGDVVMTRRNNPEVGVANRETWTITRVRGDGSIAITDSERGYRELPADYVARFVELGYATTGYGAQGDTTDTAHLILTDKTSAASAYVALTRGRYANTAHLVAQDVHDAREQWINCFARHRADLGPAHAASLAARDAANYAKARPLDRVLTDLQTAWREQAEAQRELDHAVAMRQRWAAVAAAQADRDRALAPLHARRQAAQQAAEAARAAVEHSARLIEQHIARIRDDLAEQWRAQREHARDAARTVQAGPGRLGHRLLRVNRATEELARWSLAWQPYLPEMPTDTAGIARYATWWDNTERQLPAFEAYARAIAERAHPDHPALQQAAEQADQQHEQATRELFDRRSDYHTDLVDRHGSLAYAEDAAERLDQLDPHLTATRQRLAGVEQRLDQLIGEPAIVAQPAGWLQHAQHAWQTAEIAAEAARQEQAEARAAQLQAARRAEARQHEAYQHQYGHGYGHDAGPSFGI